MHDMITLIFASLIMEGGGIALKWPHRIIHGMHDSAASVGRSVGQVPTTTRTTAGNPPGASPIAEAAAGCPSGRRVMPVSMSD